MKPQEIVIRVVVEQATAAPAPTDGFVEVTNGKDRTPSQQLRLALMRKHKASGGLKEDFEDYYQEQVKRIIRAIDRN